MLKRCRQGVAGYQVRKIEKSSGSGTMGAYKVNKAKIITLIAKRTSCNELDKG